MPEVTTDPVVTVHTTTNPSIIAPRTTVLGNLHGSIAIVGVVILAAIYMVSQIKGQPLDASVVAFVAGLFGLNQGISALGLRQAADAPAVATVASVQPNTTTVVTEKP